MMRALCTLDFVRKIAQVLRVATVKPIVMLAKPPGLALSLNSLVFINAFNRVFED
jgi:hypothetical protein